MQNTVEQFIAQCDRFFASKEGREACTGRDSWLVQVEKLRGETFARCARQAMESASDGAGIRVAVECSSSLLPIICAKVVDTAVARIPYIFRRQKWSPFKKHENVLVLLAHKCITSPDFAISLSDLGKMYDETGLPPFDPSLPWVGVGLPDSGASNSEDEGKFDLNLAYKVESVRFEAANSRIIVKAVDFSDEIMFEV